MTEQTTLERIDQLLGYAFEQRDTYIKNIGHAPQYHLGYIAALRAIRQHDTTVELKECPSCGAHTDVWPDPPQDVPLVILGQGDYETRIHG